MTDRLRHLRLGLALPALFVAVAAQATEPKDDALLRLEKVTIFAIGPVGYAGVMSGGERDYRLIMTNSPERALQLLNDVYAKGDVQGRAYALVGIRKLDPARFQELYLALSSSKDMAQVESGCIVSSRKLQEIAGEIKEGKFPYDK